MVIPRGGDKPVPITVQAQNVMHFKFVFILQEISSYNYNSIGLFPWTNYIVPNLEMFGLGLKLLILLILWQPLLRRFTAKNAEVGPHDLYNTASQHNNSKINCQSLHHILSMNSKSESETAQSPVVTVTRSQTNFVTNALKDAVWLLVVISA